jgi:prevent-host-death family protein
VLRGCYDCRMSEVASRDLRNDTAGVLKRVENGEDVVITVNGKPVARLVPVRPVRRRWIPRADLVARLVHGQADPGLRADLAALAGDTTDDLRDIG